MNLGIFFKIWSNMQYECRLRRAPTCNVLYGACLGHIRLPKHQIQREDAKPRHIAKYQEKLDELIIQ